MHKLPFVYLVTIAVAANGTSTPQISIATDADFEHHETKVVSSLDGETDIRPNNFTLISKTSSGQEGSSAEMPQPLIGGFLAQPVIYARRATIDFKICDTTNSAQTVTVAYIGYKIFA